MFREAKFLLVTSTTVTSKITAVTSLAKTCIQTCEFDFNSFPACPMSQRKKKREIAEDSLSFMSADINASKVR